MSMTANSKGSRLGKASKNAARRKSSRRTFCGYRVTSVAAAIRAALQRRPGVITLLAGAPAAALAAPQGADIAAGSVTVSTPDAFSTVINQASNKSIINWQQFSIAGNEYVQFVQPGSSAISLNRVVGGNPSAILGSLSANGQVFLVNPQGIFFGAGATVDVGAMVASTLDISNENFLAGNYVFTKPGNGPVDAGVVNEGAITARDGGYVVLAGDYAHNKGVIQAQLGAVVLAAGAEMTLDVAGDGLVNFTVDAATVSDLAGVENTGDLFADGGRVIMTADVANNLIGAAVNNSGRVQAKRIVNEGGAIYLAAAGDGDLVNSGTLDASAAAAGGEGGYVRLATKQGSVTLAPSAQVLAEGIDAGDGGTVVLRAADTLAVESGATVSARGGDQGDGGFVEVSGHQGLAVAGAVDTGPGGTLAVDPNVLNIVPGFGGFSSGYGGTATVGESFLESLLRGGSVSDGVDVWLAASDAINFNAGPIDGRNLFGGGNVGGALFVGIGNLGSPSNGFFQGSPAPTFNPDAAGTVSLNGDSIQVDGDLTIKAGSSSGDIRGVNNLSGNNVTLQAPGGAILSRFGTVSINGAGAVNVVASGGVFASDSSSASINIFAGGGPVTINADLNVTVSSGDGASAVLAVRGVGVTVNGDISVKGSTSISTAAASASLDAGTGALAVNGNVSIRASGSDSSSAVATLTYKGGSIFQVGDVSVVATSSDSGFGNASVRAMATATLTASGGGVTVSDGSVSVAANASKPVGLGGAPDSASASASLAITATNGDVTFTNADLFVSGQASNSQNANSSGGAPTALATAQANVQTLGSGNVIFTGGASHNGDLQTVAGANATGSSATTGSPSFNVIVPRSSAGAFTNVVAQDGVAIDGSVLALVDANQSHFFGTGSNAPGGAHVHVQAINSDASLNGSVAARFGVGSAGSAVAENARARVELMTGQVVGGSPSPSYVAGGDVLINPGASVLAEANGLDRASASVDLFAVEDRLSPVAPITGGGNVVINGASLTARATEGLGAGASPVGPASAEADINIEALGGAVTVTNAVGPLLASAVGNDATPSNVGAFASIGAGLASTAVAGDASVEITLTNTTVEARTNNAGGVGEFVGISAGGDVMQTGGSLLAGLVAFNPSHTSSGGVGPSPGGQSNAVIDVATNANIIGVGNNLTSLTVNNQFLGTASLAFGASYNAQLGTVVLNGGSGTGAITVAGAGNINFVTDASVGALSVTAGAITKANVKDGTPVNALTLTATSGDIALNGAFSISASSQARLLVNAAGNVSLGQVDLAASSGSSFSAELDVQAAGNIAFNGLVNVAESASSGSAHARIHADAGGSLAVNAAMAAMATGSTNALAEIDLLADGAVSVNGLGVTADAVANGGTGDATGRLQVQSRNGAVTVNPTLRATGSGQRSGRAQVAVLTGVDFGGSQQGGGNLTLAGRVDAIAVGPASASASIQVAAFGDTLAGPPGGNVAISGSGLTARATEAAGGPAPGGPSPEANAEIEVVAGDGTVTLNAPILAEVIANDRIAFADVLLEAGGGATLNNTIQSLIAGGLPDPAGTGPTVALTGGGTISGPGLVTANLVAFNPSYQSSGSSPVQRFGNANAAFNVKTDASILAFGDNLTSVTVDNSAHVGLTTAGFGAKFTSFGGLSSSAQFLGGSGNGAFTITTAGNLNIADATGLRDVNVGSLTLNVAGNIDKSVVFGVGSDNRLKITTANDFTVNSGTLNVTDGIFASVDIIAGGNVTLQTANVLSSSSTAGGAMLQVQAGSDVTLQGPVLVREQGHGTANATVDITATGLLTVSNSVDAVGIASTGAAFAQVHFTAGSMDLAANVTAQASGSGALTEEVLLDASGPVTNTPGGSNRITAATLGLNTLGGSAAAVFGSSANPIRVDVGDVNLGTLGQAFLDNAFAGIFQLDPAAVAGQNLTLQLAGGLNLASSAGLTILNVDGLDLDIGGVITADAPKVQITSTGGIAIKAAGFNLTGSVSSASLTMFASSDIVLDTPINLTDNGATPNVLVDIRSLQSLTVNQAILADATGTSGASVRIDLKGGSSTGAVNINANVSAIARAQGAGGPFPFDPTVNIIGEGTADVFLNTGTVLAKVSNGGPATPIGGTALVHVEAMGGDMTQAAAHVAKAEATGGTNATNATVELTADDQVNVSGTVLADARGAAAVSALAHIHEHIGAAAGAVNVTGATITASVADFGTPGAGTRSATLEVLSEQGGVAIDGATVLTDSAVTTTGSAFATGTIRGTGGTATINTALNVSASAGSFASALLDVDGNTGVVTTANLAANATELGSGTANSRILVDTFTGNVSLADVQAGANGGVADTQIQISNPVDVPGTLTVGNVTGNATATRGDGDLFINLDALGGVTVNGAINATAAGGTSVGASGNATVDMDGTGPGAGVTVTGPVTVTATNQATATGGSADASFQITAQGDINVGAVTVTGNALGSDADGDIDLFALGKVTTGNLSVAVNAADDGIASIEIFGSSNGSVGVGGKITTGNLSVTAVGAGTGDATASIDIGGASDVLLGNLLATADGGSDATASVEVFGNNRSFTPVGGSLTVGNVTLRASAATSDASVNLDLFASNDLVTGVLDLLASTDPLTGDSGDGFLRARSKIGNVTINGGLTLDVRARDYIGSIEASISAGTFGVAGGDITINGNAQVMTLGSYASAELHVTAFSNGGVGGDITVNGDAIAKALWRAGTSSSDNTAIVDLDARGGLVTVTGQTLAQASHQSSESARASIDINGRNGVNLQAVMALATAPNSDASASVNLSAFNGNIIAGPITVNAVGDVASGDAFADLFGSAFGGGNITLNGATNVSATGGTALFDRVDARARFGGPGSLFLNGPLTVRTTGGGASAFGSRGAEFFGSMGNIVSGQLITATADQSFQRSRVGFDGFEGGGSGTLNVRTSAREVQVANYANATVDNTAFTGPAELDFFGSLGNVNVTTGGDATLISGLNASGSVLVGATGGLDVNGQSLSANVIDLIAQTGDILLSGASVVAPGGVFMSAGGSVLNGPALIDGGMVGIIAGGNIDLGLSDIFIGSASNGARLNGDLPVTDFLQANDVPVPNLNPNGLFKAGGTLTLGNLDIAGHYLWLQGQQVDLVGSVNSPPNIVVQLLPANPASTIGLEGSPGGGQQVNFNALEHFDPFTGTTFVIGGSFHDGDIFVGENGVFDIGAANLLLATSLQGSVNGLGNVTGTGLIAALQIITDLETAIQAVLDVDDPDAVAALVESVENDIENADQIADEDEDEEDDEDTDAVVAEGEGGPSSSVEEGDAPAEDLSCG